MSGNAEQLAHLKQQILDEFSQTGLTYQIVSNEHSDLALELGGKKIDFVPEGSAYAKETKINCNLSVNVANDGVKIDLNDRRISEAPIAAIDQSVKDTAEAMSSMYLSSHHWRESRLASRFLRASDPAANPILPSSREEVQDFMELTKRKYDPRYEQMLNY